MAFSLSYEVYVLLEEAFNHDRAKAEQFAHAVEASLSEIKAEAVAGLTAQQESTKAQVYNELRNELATREFVRAEINDLRAEFKEEINGLRVEVKEEINGLRLEVKEEINNLRLEVKAEINEVRAEINELRAELKQQGLLLKALIAIAVFGLTLFNPSFVRLVEVLMK